MDEDWALIQTTRDSEGRPRYLFENDKGERWLVGWSEARKGYEVISGWCPEKPIKLSI
jgi:hypothetical protein